MMRPLRKVVYFALRDDILEIAGTVTHLSGDFDNENGAGGVQHHVHQMIAPGFKTTQKMIQTKGGHAERSIASVRATLRQWCSPEVIFEQPVPRCARQQVRVCQDGSSAAKK